MAQFFGIAFNFEQNSLGLFFQLGGFSQALFPIIPISICDCFLPALLSKEDKKIKKIQRWGWEAEY